MPSTTYICIYPRQGDAEQGTPQWAPAQVSTQETSPGILLNLDLQYLIQHYCSSLFFGQDEIPWACKKKRKKKKLGKKKFPSSWLYVFQWVTIFLTAISSSSEALRKYLGSKGRAIAGWQTLFQPLPITPQTLNSEVFTWSVIWVRGEGCEQEPEGNRVERE